MTIVGRKDDMLLSGGENVHPVQIEEALDGHPSVTDSLVVGVPDDKWGQIVVAYVVTTAPVPSADDLDDFCRRHPMLSQFKRPRAYRFVGVTPRVGDGKEVALQGHRHRAPGVRERGVRRPGARGSHTVSS